MSDWALVLGGLAMLALGGELLVQGAVRVARALGVPPLVVGLTIVGFGTSVPELVTSLQAALSGSPGIALGNVIGSNIANILLILGLTALLCPIAVDPVSFRRDGSVLLAATVCCCGAVAFDALTAVSGAVFVAALAAYVTGTFVLERHRGTSAGDVYAAEADLIAESPGGAGPSFLRAVAGLVLTLMGARLLVSGAVGIAQALGVADTLIGLTIVAVGTSVPELVTSLVALRRGAADVAFGNIVGSNIFNILGILGLTSLVQPLAIPPGIVRFDIWVMAGTTALFLVFAMTGWRIARREGGLLLAGYAGYLAVLLAGA